MDWIIEQLKLLLIGISYFFFVYVSVYAVKHAWENAKNAVVSKHKVCDVCWRDINKVNKALKDK